MLVTSQLVVQPVPRPATVEEYLAVRPLMVDSHGAPLVTARCGACGVEHFTVEPCAAEVRCPRCGSTAARCRRPSGHDAAAWHSARWVELDRVSSEREARGLPAVARWPGPDA